MRAYASLDDLSPMHEVDAMKAWGRWSVEALLRRGHSEVTYGTLLSRVSGTGPGLEGPTPQGSGGSHVLGMLRRPLHPPLPHLRQSRPRARGHLER